MRPFAKRLSATVLCTLCAASLAQAAETDGSRRQMMQQRLQQHFQQMDSNGDGKISHDEFMANAERQFQRLDANHDGVIDQDELRNLRNLMPRAGQGGAGAQFP